MPRLSERSLLAKDQRSAEANDVMQHRHFAVVAGIIAKLAEGPIRSSMAKHFADELASTNSKFNRQRFLKACGV